MKCKHLLLIVLLFFVFNIFAQKIDINQASFEEIKKLPITDKQAKAIYDYRTYIDFFKSIYDLREIPEIDQKTLNNLKPYVRVSHHKESDAAAQRREDIYYLIERLGSNEGSQEGMSDVWVDYLMTPRNINKITFTEILNMPNVNAQDAAAIMQRRARKDTIADYRDLRNTPGITHYAATNLKNYIYYKEQKSDKNLFFDYQFKLKNEPFEDDAKEMLQESMVDSHSRKQSYWGFLNLDESQSEITNKFSMRYGHRWKAGFMYNSNDPEDGIFISNKDTKIDDAKFYVGSENEFDFMGRNYLKVYAGNFRASFGEGLVFENTDYFSPRNTGFGFNKKIKGISPDLSRTQEYAAKGIAFDLQRNNMSASFFMSKDKKDAVIWDSNKNNKIDDDDAVLTYITMSKRFSNDDLIKAEAEFDSLEYSMTDAEDWDDLYFIDVAPRKDALEETIYGGHMEFSPVIGTHFGVTAYEAIYDRDFIIPEEDELKELLIEDYADRKWKLADNEISALYSTKSEKYEYDRDYRRIIGFDFGTVYNKVSFQGEYAELLRNGSFSKIGDDPKAMLFSAYAQFDNFYLLSLYRDYDIDFDNPYGRSFSESERFDDTVFEKLSYGLDNTLLADVYLNSAQPSAERGIYLETRYRFNSHFTITKAYVDFWERKSDGRNNIRFEGTLDYRPLYQVSMSVRYKHQIKRYDDNLSRNRSQTDETTLRFRTSLSNRDRIQLEYRYSRTYSPPYTNLTNSVEPGGADIYQANSLFEGDYVAVDYTHNFNKYLKAKGSFMFWDGNHWDFEDVNIDFFDDAGIKYWLTLQSRISNNLYLSMKYKIKQFKTHEKEFRQYNDIPDEGEYYYQRVERTDSSIRLQIDWKY